MLSCRFFYSKASGPSHWAFEFGQHALFKLIILHFYLTRQYNPSTWQPHCILPLSSSPFKLMIFFFLFFFFSFLERAGFPWFSLFAKIIHAFSFFSITLFFFHFHELSRRRFLKETVWKLSRNRQSSSENKSPSSSKSVSFLFSKLYLDF